MSRHSRDPEVVPATVALVRDQLAANATALGLTDPPCPTCRCPLQVESRLVPTWETTDETVMYGSVSLFARRAVIVACTNGVCAWSVEIKEVEL